MTPEEAKQLRDKATHGPWELERIDGLLHVVLPTGNGAPEEGDLPLIAAAPDLAETVASLRYEYAVQAELDGLWRYKAMHAMWTDNALHADWTRDLEEAEDDAAVLGTRITVRVVRRLAGEPEVVE